MPWSMKTLTALGAALIVWPASFAHADFTVWRDDLSGSLSTSDDTFVLGGGTTRGTLQLIVGYDDINGPFLTEGPLGFGVQSSDPGVIALTAGFIRLDSPGVPTLPDISDPANRFDRGLVEGLSADGIDALVGVIGSGVGLDPTVPGNADGPLPNSFIFAEIDYEVLGPGTTTLSLSAPDAPVSPTLARLFETDDFDFGAVRIQVVPEPASLGLVGAGLLTIFARRRPHPRK